MKQGRYQAITYITFFGMEGCCLYAIIHLLNEKAVGGELSVPLLLLLYPLAFLVSILLARLHWHKTYLRTINWVILVVMILLMVKVQLFGGVGLLDSTWLTAVPQAIKKIFFSFEPALLILLVSISLWWLGQRMSHIKANFTTAIAELQFGLIILLITLFSIRQLDVEFSAALGLVIAFVIFALLGISITHAREGKGWLSGLAQGHWTSVLIACIITVVLLGLLIAALVTPDFLELILKGLEWIWNSIVAALIALGHLLSLPEMESIELEPTTVPPDETGEALAEVGRRIMSESVRRGIEITVGIVFLTACILALWRISSQILDWLRNRLKGSGDVQVTTMHGAFKDDLINFLKSILRKVFSIFRFRPAFLRSRKKTELLSPEAVSVHQVYRQFLRWAAKKGYPREIHQTPNEYSYAVANLLPEAEGELGFLTRLYVSTRYGLSLPGENELHKLRQSWQHVKQCHFRKPAKNDANEKERIIPDG